MTPVKVKFKVLEIIDKRNGGSSLEVGNIYKGILINNWVYWTDPMNDQDWCFYVGDTCEIINVNP